jgi:DNA-binding XRE family transcriptional regulator
MIYDHVANTFHAKRLSQLIGRAPVDANSPEKLSKLTGISLENIKLLEAGKIEPTLNMAYKLAAAFRIPLENLYADDQEIKTRFEPLRKA